MQRGVVGERTSDGYAGSLEGAVCVRRQLECNLMSVMISKFVHVEHCKCIEYIRKMEMMWQVVLTSNTDKVSAANNTIQVNY